jgi:hypothetical protein
MTGPEGAAAVGGGGILASHAERDVVVGVLKDAFVQGRLTRDEFEARAGEALGARTRFELAELTGDLPAVSSQLPAAGRLRLVERRPVFYAVAGSGGCLAAAIGLVFLAAHVFDAGGFGNPVEPWSSVCAVMAVAALITGLGMFIHGLSTADAQRQARQRTPTPPVNVTPG